MREYFFGWYFKNQSPKQSVAIIPALHKSKDNKSCSIQIITNDSVYNACFPYEEFKRKKRFGVDIEDNHFSKYGIELNISTSEFTAKGTLKFGPFSPIKYDIMGPFKFVPFMECRHSVISMEHTVSGTIEINGVNYTFDNDIGYIEGDRGYSFPKKYAWTHSFFENGSIMLSVATIPLGPIKFNGIIGVAAIDKKEYRIATYLGAKVKKISDGEAIVKQGKTTLSAKLMEKNAHPLYAPNGGEMSRTIHESLCAKAKYHLERKGQALLSFETDKASFEYEL